MVGLVNGGFGTVGAHPRPPRPIHLRGGAAALPHPPLMSASGLPDSHPCIRIGGPVAFIGTADAQSHPGIMHFNW